jgi:benzoyl-CoA reductase subunit C
MPVYVPRELIHAAGMLPLGIMGEATAWRSSTATPTTRATSAASHARPSSWGCPGASTSSTACSSQHLRRDPQPVRHVEAAVPGQVRALLRRAAELSRRRRRQLLPATSWTSCGRPRAPGGRKITGGAAGVDRALQREPRLVAGLYTMRAASRGRCPRPKLYLLMRAGLVLPVEEHNQMLSDYHAAAEEEACPARQLPRVIGGSFCEQPPLGPDQVDRARRLLHRR